MSTIATLHVELPHGAVDIPYVDVRADAPGPHLTIVAGVHGTEYTSIAAVREFAAGLDGALQRGRITAVPVVNLSAFWARTPFVVPEDAQNLNRSFPGDPGGSAAPALAHAITKAFIEPTDYLLDLHAGDLPEALEPFALYDESPVEEQAREMAFHYGLKHVVRQAKAGRTVGGSTSAVAADLGIPAITAESGQNGILDRASVERHLAGLTNVARQLGILAGTAVEPPSATVHEGWEWLHTEVTGWWEPAVPVGTELEAGDLIGVVSDLLGAGRHEVRATEAGVPLFLTSSPAVVAGGLLAGVAHAGR